MRFTILFVLLTLLAGLIGFGAYKVYEIYLKEHENYVFTATIDKISPIAVGQELKLEYKGKDFVKVIATKDTPIFSVSVNGLTKANISQLREGQDINIVTLNTKSPITAKKIYILNGQ